MTTATFQGHASTVRDDHERDSAECFCFPALVKRKDGQVMVVHNDALGIFLQLFPCPPAGVWQCDDGSWYSFAQIQLGDS